MTKHRCPQGVDGDSQKLLGARDGIAAGSGSRNRNRLRCRPALRLCAQAQKPNTVSEYPDVWGFHANQCLRISFYFSE